MDEFDGFEDRLDRLESVGPYESPSPLHAALLAGAAACAAMAIAVVSLVFVWRDGPSSSGAGTGTASVGDVFGLAALALLMFFTAAVVQACCSIAALFAAVVTFARARLVARPARGWYRAEAVLAAVVALAAVPLLWVPWF